MSPQNEHEITSLITDAEDFPDPFEKILDAATLDAASLLEPETLADIAALAADDPNGVHELLQKLAALGCDVTPIVKRLRSESRSSPKGSRDKDILLTIARRGYYFHDEDRTPYADLIIDGHRRTMPVRANSFESFLRGEFFRETEEAPSKLAVAAAIDTLAAHAEHGGSQHTVHFRVAEEGGCLYLDIGDNAGSVVAVDQSGWSIIRQAPVRFIRHSAMRSLPLPERGGGIGLLRNYINVEHEYDFRLLVFVMVAALWVGGPYPILVFAGEQGSAKTTATEFTRALIDPSKSLHQSLPRNVHDLFITAHRNQVLAFDNVSGLSGEMSDALCRLSTGGGFATRKLWTDDEEQSFNAMRPIVMNGIVNFLTRADLADRAIVVQLATIAEDKRRSVGELKAAFEADRPLILGALLDAISLGMSRLPDIRLPTMPRMADFARKSVACERALFGDGSFQEAYEKTEIETLDRTLEADPIASVIIDLMKAEPVWQGTASELSNHLARHPAAARRSWPDSPQALGNHLSRIIPLLRKAGIEVERGRVGASRERVTRIWRRDDGTVANTRKR